MSDTFCLLYFWKEIELLSYRAVDNGVHILYSDGTKRFISNNWYIDIDTDQL